MRAFVALFLAFFTWQGLWLSVEQTQNWRTPLKPGWSFSATSLVGVGPLGVRLVYIQPTNSGPLVQMGVSVRVF